MTDLNKLSLRVALKEVGKKQVSIAQIKEIIGIICVELAMDKADDGQDLYKSMVQNGSKKLSRIIRGEGNET